MLRIISDGKIYTPCKNGKKNAMKCKTFLGMEFKCWKAKNISRNKNYCFNILKYTSGHM